MATTTNFNWPTPNDTDLVKDGASAMRSLGNAIDSSFLDLKGGTTGQVLSKASGTDLDFTWVAQDDSNAIQNAIVDAKGDLISATAADTPARLAVGTNGQVLMADSTTATGLKWGAVTGGGLTLIASANPSGATGVDFNSIDSSYKELYIEWNGVQSGAASTIFDVRFNTSSGSIYFSKGFQGNGSTASASQQDGTSVWATPGLVAQNASAAQYGNVSRGYLRVFNANSTTKYKNYQAASSYYDTSVGWRTTSFVGDYEDTAAISSINIVRIGGSGTITTLANGVINLWGLK